MSPTVPAQELILTRRKVYQILTKNVAAVELIIRVYATHPVLTVMK